MSPEELAPLVRRLRRSPIVPLSEPAQAVLARGEVERLIPHRGSMLLLDRIDFVAPSARTLRAKRRVDPEDPVFAGHFPGSPVYPGVLLVEMMGQAGLCLLPLLRPHEAHGEGGATPSFSARLTHVHHATFLAPVLPGMEVTVHAGLAEEGLTLTAFGQVFHEQTLCAFAVSEVYVDQ